MIVVAPGRDAMSMTPPFFSTKESGTGMGMAIVHSLATQHGGVIDIASRPGATTITVALPRRQRGG